MGQLDIVKRVWVLLGAERNDAADVKDSVYGILILAEGEFVEAIILDHMGRQLVGQ